ncbi:MAG: hypothetical protein WDN28_30365 [Chthoniobacter sp.]
MAIVVDVTLEHAAQELRTFERVNLHALPHEQAEWRAVRLKVAAVHPGERPALLGRTAEVESAVGVVHHGKGVRLRIEGHYPECGVAGLILHSPLGEFQGPRARDGRCSLAAPIPPWRTGW